MHELNIPSMIWYNSPLYSLRRNQVYELIVDVETFKFPVKPKRSWEWIAVSPLFILLFLIPMPIYENVRIKSVLFVHCYSDKLIWMNSLLLIREERRVKHEIPVKVSAALTPLDLVWTRL